MVDFAGKQPTEMKYTFNARVKVLEKGFVDSRGRQLSARLVLLLPVMEDTAVIRFLFAWQPEVDEEKPGEPQYFELTGYITTTGLHTPSRFAILNASPLCTEQPYMTVMSVGPKVALEKMDGRKVEVTVLPESEDDTADGAITE